MTDEDECWWKTCSLREFEDRVAGVPIDGLDRIGTAITAVMTSIRGQLDHKESPHPEWERRAEAALSIYVEKKKLLRVAMKPLRQRRKEDLLGDVRVQIEAGDLSGALQGLVDYLREIPPHPLPRQGGTP